MSLGSWNIWAIVSQFGVDCCGHVAHSSMLELGSLYLTYFVFIWVSRKQGGPPFQAEQIPLPKNTTVTFTHVIFVYMCGPWIGKGGRERDRESVCVQSLHSQSRNNFRWRRVRETQISHDIAYLWHLRKWTYLQNRLTEKELTVTRRDSVRERFYGKFGIDIYTWLYFNGWPTRMYCIKQRILPNIL